MALNLDHLTEEQLRTILIQQYNNFQEIQNENQNLKEQLEAAKLENTRIKLRGHEDRRLSSQKINRLTRHKTIAFRANRHLHGEIDRRIDQISMLQRSLKLLL